MTRLYRIVALLVAMAWMAAPLSAMKAQSPREGSKTSQAKSDASKPPASAKASEKSPSPADATDQPSTYAAEIGRQDRGKPFLLADGHGAVIVGCEVSLYPYAGHTMVIHSIKPIFELPDGTRKDGAVCGRLNHWIVRVEAEHGYAVAGMSGKAGDRVEGFSLVFMRRRGDQLDSADQYSSRWLGTRSGNPLVGVKDAKNRPAIGFSGRNGDDIDALDALGLAFQ